MKKFNNAMCILQIAGVLCLIAAIILIVLAIHSQTSSVLPFYLIVAAFVLLVVGSLRKSS